MHACVKQYLYLLYTNNLVSVLLVTKTNAKGELVSQANRDYKPFNLKI